MLSYFRSAAATRGQRALAADSNPLAPALYQSDGRFRLPRLTSEDYLWHLLDLVKREHVQLLVPTIDTELAILAQHSSLFTEVGCTALVSSERLIEVTSDKWLTAHTYSQGDIRTPRSWLPDDVVDSDLPERLFLKPRNGSASQHAYASHRDQLRNYLAVVPDPIIQERLEGPEITVDALLDLEGRPIHCVPRTRLRTLGGESIEAVTIDDRPLHSWLMKVLEFTSTLGGRGPITLQAFLTPNGPVLTEINPRFGGGFPLTYAAGGHYPELILREVSGERLTPHFGDYKIGLYMTRYYVEHFTDELPWN